MRMATGPMRKRKMVSPFNPLNIGESDMKRLIRSELIESVLAEMKRVWGANGFGGEVEAYA